VHLQRQIYWFVNQVVILKQTKGLFISRKGGLAGSVRQTGCFLPISGQFSLPDNSPPGQSPSRHFSHVDNSPSQTVPLPSFFHPGNSLLPTSPLSGPSWLKHLTCPSKCGPREVTSCTPLIRIHMLNYIFYELS